MSIKDKIRMVKSHIDNTVKEFERVNIKRKERMLKMNLKKYLITHNHKLIKIIVIPENLKEGVLKWYMNRKGYEIIEQQTKINKGE